MSVKFEETATNEGVLYFTVAEKEAQAALKQAYQKIKGKVSLPGFRKGKVSYSVFCKMVGVESLYQDALNLVLPGAYAAAAEESGLDLVGRPTFDIEDIQPTGEWKLKAIVATKPSVTLGDYKGLEVAKQEREVSEEDIAARLKQAQASLAELTLKEGEAEEGNTVVIDYEGFKDGKAFEGGKGENHSLELGSHSFIPGFEEQLVGVKEGDEKEIQVTFPSEYHAEELAGQEATFKVKVHEVKSKFVPELNDEFAKDVDEEVNSLDELKAKYKKELEEQKATAADEAVEEEAIRKAVENASFTAVPKAMVEEEVDRQVDHYLNEMKRQGITPELFFQLTNSNEEQLRKQFAEDAETRVKTNLMLEAIIEAENIQANDEDVENEIKNLAETYKMEEEAVRKVVTTDMLKHDIELKKAMELITSSAVEK